jgi:hypothetical protein
VYSEWGDPIGPTVDFLLIWFKPLPKFKHSAARVG